jgi:glycosyltransferase involved in cell wall biosynthesis
LKLSVVTVSYNAASTLADTLESVSRQQGCDVEHWLIDGGSRDDTATVVRRHGAHLAGFISEPDRGLYDAMNKGAARSLGDVLGFLNADDWYADASALAWVVNAFRQGADIVYGDLVFVTPAHPFEVRRVWRDAAHTPRDFFHLGWQPAHPTTFVRRELFESVGGFDLRWRVSADYAFLARAMSKPGTRLRHVPRTLVNMRLGGASTADWHSVWRANRECVDGGHSAWGTVGLKLLRKLPQLLVQPASDNRPLWRPWSAA